MYEKHFVYRHIRLDTNQVFYIGIGTKTGDYKSHKSEYRRAYDRSCRNLFWKRIKSKTDIKVEIMFESDSYSEILLKEQEIIKLYGRRNLLEGTLVNLTDGGEGVLGQVVSDETRLKISKAGTGVKRSDEHKASISQANRDRIYTQEMRDKVSKKHKGKVISQEQREKLSKVSKGVKKSEEMKEKLRATRLAKGIHVLDLETGIEFDTLKIACEATNYRYGRALAQILYNYKVKRFIRVNDEKEKLTKPK